MAAITALTARSDASAVPFGPSHQADSGYVRSVTCRHAVVRTAWPSAGNAIRKYAERLLPAIATPEARPSKLTAAMNLPATLKARTIGRRLLPNAVLMWQTP